MALKQLVALTEIHRTVTPGKAADKAAGTPAIKPVVKVIAPGAVFKAVDADQEKELLGMAAAKVQDSEDKVAVPVVEDSSDEDKTAKAAKEAEDAAAAAAAEAAKKDAPDAEAELAAAQAEYEEVTGKKPGSMKAETLRKKTAEKRAADAEAAKDLV